MEDCTTFGVKESASKYIPCFYSDSSFQKHQRMSKSTHKKAKKLEDHEGTTIG